MTIIVLCLLIVLLLIILLVLINKESFDILASEQITSKKIDLQETYQWPCNGCATSTSLKPKFKYNLTDNRCLATNVNDYTTLTGKLVDIYNYKIEPNIYFQSCSATSNTMYSSVVGRYIILRNNTRAFTIGSLYLQNKSASTVTSAFVSYTASSIYVEPVINKTGVVWPTTNYIQIDFGVNTVEIGSIIITHNNKTDATNFTLTDVIVAKDYGPDPENALIVFSTNVTDTSLTKTVYTQDSAKILSPNTYIPVFKQFTWPCTNCLTYTNTLFKNFKYSVADGRCYKPKDYISSSYLTNAINNTLVGADLDLRFASCLTTSDTRMAPDYIYDVSSVLSAGTKVNGPVTKWQPSKGGIYNDTVFFGYSTMPTLVMKGKKYAINFYNSYMAMPETTIKNSVSYTMIIAYRWTSVPWEGFIIGYKAYDPGWWTGNFIQLSGNGSNLYLGNISLVQASTSFTPVIDDVYVSIIAYDSVKKQFNACCNNIMISAPYTVLNYTPTGGGSWVIGSTIDNYSSLYSASPIAVHEVQFYKRALSTSEMSLVRDSLIAKWK